MKERALWRIVREALGPYGDVQRIEDALELGVWDVNYALRVRIRIIEGWLELKTLLRWPIRCGPVWFEHLTPQQVAWGERRAAAGGRVHLLSRIGTAYTLHEARWIRSIYNRALDADAFIGAAAVYSPTDFPTREILLALDKTSVIA